MPRFIVDASFVIKWFFSQQEKGVLEARNVYALLREGKISLSAPSFLLVEVINVYLKKKKLSKDETLGIVKLLLESGIEFVDFNYSKANDLLNVSTQYGLSAYDAMYLLLAVEMECRLISDDGRLKKISELVVGVEGVKRVYNS